MYACMYVCMYVCMHVCMYVCMHACMSVCMHACTDVCIYHIYICMCRCGYVQFYARMYIWVDRCKARERCRQMTCHHLYLMQICQISSLSIRDDIPRFDTDQSPLSRLHCKKRLKCNQPNKANSLTKKNNNFNFDDFKWWRIQSS